MIRSYERKSRTRGRERNAPLFSYRHAPLKLPSKILTGFSTNRGPTSDSDKCGRPFFFASFCACVSVRAEADEEVEASASGEGASRICRWVGGEDRTLGVSHRLSRHPFRHASPGSCGTRSFRRRWKS